MVRYSDNHSPQHLLMHDKVTAFFRCGKIPHAFFGAGRWSFQSFSHFCDAYFAFGRISPNFAYQFNS